jgi:alpha-galactosidase
LNASVLIFLLALLSAPMSWALTNGLALTPPMGWNSWNNFGCGINEAIIRATADAMATNGMKAAGYQFVNMDDCWAVSRDPTGVLMADPARFPSGIKALADYVHADGLKLGVYSDHGVQTCGGRPGGYSYEYLDANTYASWGVDYLKYDNCNWPPGDVPQSDYFHMSDALMRSGRPITFSICAWSFSSWDPELGNLWRTTGDISDSYGSMVSKLAPNSQSAYVAGLGRWNDPDMLEVGRAGMSTLEDQTHFTLWCIMAAPLIAGNDLTSMSAQTLAILTNPEVIAVDQDATGEQGIQVAGSTSNQVWCKPLGTDFRSKAVALFNNDTNMATMTVTWTDLGLQAGAATVRDLWARRDLGSFSNGFTTNVPAHGVVLLKVTGTAPAIPGSTGLFYLSDLTAAYAYVGWGSMTKDRSIGGNTIMLNGATYGKGLGVHAFSGVEYRLGAIASRFQADIGVDDEVGVGYGSVVFQVYADGMKIYDSGVMHGGDPHQTLNLDVTGVNRLTLGVNDADDNISYDHADWAGARVAVLSTIPAVPLAPTGLMGTPGNPIGLAWNATRGATSYNLKRALASAGPYTNVAAVELPAFSDTNVIPGTTYYYSVSASNAVGESASSSPVTVTGCAMPDAPLGLVAGTSGGQFTLGWNPAAGASSYNVVRATSATPFNYVATGLTGTFFIDTNVLAGVTYFYRVAASNACNQGLFSEPVAVSTPPPAPVGLTAMAVGTRAFLSWTPLPTTVGYDVKRSSVSGGPLITLASNLTGPPWLDSGLSANNTYYYVVAAVNAGGEGANSAEAVMTTCGAALPNGWSDQDIGSVGVAGSGSGCADAFAVEGGGDDIWNNADAFNFLSRALSGDNSIIARVMAVENTDGWAKGGVMFRNDTTAGSMFADAFVSPGNGVNFQWRASTGGTCGSAGISGITAPVWVRLTRSGTSFTASYGSDGLTWTLLGTQTIPMAATVQAGLEVTAHNNATLCLAGFDNVATAAPATPAGLAGFGGNGWVNLSWNPSPGAAVYQVKRASVSGGPYTTIGNPTGSFYLDTGLTNWITAYYVVSAVNSLGESANSTEIGVTPRPPPSLGLGAGTPLSLSWPAWASGYTVFRASNLIAPVQWQVVTNIPQSTGGTFNLPITPAGRQQFFRLGAP